ncbi:MAG: hypothetical protein R3F11_25875 [Verrucomicrobiales bacterium]
MQTKTAPPDLLVASRDECRRPPAQAVVTAAFSEIGELKGRA